MSFQFFLTAYDPSDLPGGSLDPMGFDRGYLHLAEKILPNMTNVANCPRYFGLLCASVLLSRVDNSIPQAKKRSLRQATILKLEKLWALANVLAAKKAGLENLSGLRGVTYAERQAARLEKRQAANTDLDFPLLSRQTPYGAIGMYAAVAAGCQLFDRSTLDLTPGLGEPLGEAFIKETQMPPSVKAAIKDSNPAPLEQLTQWGMKSYLWNRPGGGEQKCIQEMLSNDLIRLRFSKLLSEQVPKEGEPELTRLKRIANAISGSDENLDLWESLEGIIRYEACYRLSQLALERLLYMCKRHGDAALEIQEASRDDVIKSIGTKLPKTVQHLLDHVNNATSPHFNKDKERLQDVLQFLENTAASCVSGALVENTIARHADIQHGKFDRGRRKMPWIKSSEGQLSLTLTRIGGLRTEAKRPADITPHFYRLAAADNWIRAAGGHEYWRNQN